MTRGEGCGGDFSISLLSLLFSGLILIVLLLKGGLLLFEPGVKLAEIGSATIVISQGRRFRPALPEPNFVPRIIIHSYEGGEFFPLFLQDWISEV